LAKEREWWVRLLLLLWRTSRDGEWLYKDGEAEASYKKEIRTVHRTEPTAIYGVGDMHLHYIIFPITSATLSSPRVN
jgi:hypothetical protein